MARKEGDDGGKLMLAYHTPEKLAGQIIHNEQQVGLTDVDIQLRRAQDCTDGAYIGPMTGNRIVQILNAKQGVRPGC